MKKLLFCILLSFLFFSQSFKDSKSLSLAESMRIAKIMVSWGLGDGFMKQCAKWIGCDEFEDLSLSDQLTGLFSTNQKVKVCAANSIAKNIFRGIGLGSPIMNLLGNGVQCFQAYLQHFSAEKKAESYRLCLDTQDDGHPLPMTDKQIAKVLRRTGEWVTVENIVDKYNKLCIQKGADLSTAVFYKEGESFDSIYIGHAQGYAYVLCASVFSACPCIYNIQHGKIDDPEYVTDDEGVVKMRQNGTLMLKKITDARTNKDDTEEFDGNEKYFNEHYAKHCRLIRFKEVYEQQNDLASIFDESCFDLHGYSKYHANITAGIVQCFENTARNIFEKPIMSIEVQNVADGSALDWYTKDYNTVYSYYKKINQLLGDNKTYEKARNSTIPIKSSERKEILNELIKLWHQNSTFKVDYTCDRIKAVPTGYTTSFYKKYIESPALQSTKYCCESDTKLNNKYTCFGDKYDNINSELLTNIKEDQEDISLADIYVEKENIEKLLDHLKDLKIKASKATSTIMNTKSSKGFGLTLFDIIRNRLKVIATLALVLWVVTLGWKMLLGDMGGMDVKSFGMMALKVFLCYMVVFSESAKNYLFNLSIQTAQGVGMALNQTMESFRSQRDNKYNRTCNFTSGKYYESPAVRNEDILIVKAGDDEVEKIVHYYCNPWEKEVIRKDNLGVEHHYCDEYKMTCTHEDYQNIECLEYYKDYEGTINKNYCRTGKCYNKDKTNFLQGKLFPTNSSRLADVYEEVKLNRCKLQKKEDGTYYDIVEDAGCSEYKTFFGNQVCVAHNCKNITYFCDPKYNLEKECSSKGINADGTLSGCLGYICKKTSSPFIAMPPFERPYKVVSYYGKDKDSGITLMRYFTPKCHKYNAISEKIVYDNTTDPNAELKYSPSINDYVYMCPDKPEYEGYVLDDGFRISEYIEHNIIENSDNGILVFQSLLSDEQQKLSNDRKKQLLYNYPIRTAVATIDKNGFVEEYNFIDSNQASEGFQRAKYRIYLRSLITSKNKNSDYPKIRKYGTTRNYSHLSFWDSMDCKIVQFISLQGYGDGFNEQLGDAISAVNNGDSDKLVISAINGMLQFLKFMFMCFPFGILAFILMFALGAMLFMLVARAAQQYCICIFHIVLLIYLSPFVFILYLFDRTKDALNTWLNDLKANIAGSCVPFVSISIFLFIIDYVLFGDSDHYADRNLFNANGSINEDCYEDYISDAPIACLSKKLLKKFSIWQNILYLLTGNWNGIFKPETYVIAWYLVLRALFGAALIIAMTSILDKIEDTIYKLTGKPDADIGVGFNQKASESIKSGANAGVSAGKFALSAMGTTVAVGAFALSKIGKGLSYIPGVKGLMAGAMKGIRRAKQWVQEKYDNATNYLKEKIFDKIFGNESVERATNAVNSVANITKQYLQNTIQNYNNAINEQKSRLDKELLDINSKIDHVSNNNTLSDNEKSSKIAELQAQKSAVQARYDERMSNMEQQKQSALNEIKSLGQSRLNNEIEGLSKNYQDSIRQQYNGIVNTYETNTIINETEINEDN